MAKSVCCGCSQHSHMDKGTSIGSVVQRLALRIWNLNTWILFPALRGRVKGLGVDLQVCHGPVVHPEVQHYTFFCLSSPIYVGNAILPLFTGLLWGLANSPRSALTCQDERHQISRTQDYKADWEQQLCLSRAGSRPRTLRRGGGEGQCLVVLFPCGVSLV